MVVQLQQGRRVPVSHQAVVDVDEDFAVHRDVFVPAIAVGQVIQGEDDGAVCRVLNGDHTGLDLSELDLVKDVWQHMVSQLSQDKRAFAANGLAAYHLSLPQASIPMTTLGRPGGLPG